MVENGTLVNVSLYLHGKPGWTLEEDDPVTGEQLRQYAEGLHDWLNKAAGILAKLEAAGWETQMRLFDIGLTHPEIGTKSEAEARLAGLGIDPQDVEIEEYGLEDCFGDEDCFEGVEGFEDDSE